MTWHAVTSRRTAAPIFAAHAATVADACDLIERGASPGMLWIGADVAGATREDLGRLAEAVVACDPWRAACWGPGCETLHDWIDETLVWAEVSAGVKRATIVTTWHEGETVEESVGFAMSLGEAAIEGRPAADPVYRFLLIGGAASIDRVLDAIADAGV